MRKSIVMAAVVILLAACQENKESEVTTEETTVTETPADTSAIVADTVAVTETVKEAEAPQVIKTKEKAFDVVEAAPVKDVKVDYASFGDKILADKAISKEEMMKKYKSLKIGDTLNVKFKSKVNAVCQKKGCWMALQLPGGKESFVKFKDYAFFVPLNAADQEAIISGKAFVSETSVAQLRHYAKDGGKSEADIAKITEPEFEYKFMADGVLISK
ncbi:DUF4920 domain-containing protein [Flavobacterium sp. DG1-102-2]|uniref:DUF4920 domain-containing protein n=1 Tax=Flavobacterium sp. DG1-102-2 TaxID=3081663 RepID=UPI00294A61AB|nr:DUF4920 domain-containing protein [Flavobacterium sp. DG1-102-2]MDV6170120.1 DUF4920 domain-containing protein [Flavobacterium sp. DG1-102-2]